MTMKLLLNPSGDIRKLEREWKRVKWGESERKMMRDKTLEAFKTCCARLQPRGVLRHQLRHFQGFAFIFPSERKRQGLQRSGSAISLTTAADLRECLTRVK